MRSIFAATAALALLSVPFAAPAQDKAAVVVGQTEAVVKVVKIDRKARTVTFQGPRGRQETLNVPNEAQNFDKVKVGSNFRVKYVEAIAVGLQRGGAPSATADRQVRLAPKGGTPGGVVVQTTTVTAKVVAIDYAGREVALSGPKGNVIALHVADDVQGFADVKIGDTVSLAYTQALALEMLPEPAGPPKALPTPKKD